MPLDVYQAVTDKILAALEAGTAPWRDPIITRYAADAPQNLMSGHHYRGCNVFLLAISAWSAGYASNRWLTFRQAKELGGSVRKREKGSLVVLWKPFQVEDKETGEQVDRFVLRHYTVFNSEQCDLPPEARPAAVENPAVRPVPFAPIPACEAVVEGYDGPVLVHGAGQSHSPPSR